MSYWRMVTSVIVLMTWSMMAFGCAGAETEDLKNSEEVNDENQSQDPNQNQKPDQNQNQDPDQNTGQNDTPGAERDSRVSLHSGGGVGESENYQGRLTIGAPAPAGGADSDNYSVTMGMGPAIVDAED